MRLRVYTSKFIRATTNSKKKTQFTVEQVIKIYDVWWGWEEEKKKYKFFIFCWALTMLTSPSSNKKNILTFMNKTEGRRARMNERTDNRVFINMNWGSTREMCRWVCSGSMTINFWSFLSLFARVKHRLEQFVIKYLLEFNNSSASEIVLPSQLQIFVRHIHRKLRFMVNVFMSMKKLAN